MVYSKFHLEKIYYWKLAIINFAVFFKLVFFKSHEKNKSRNGREIFFGLFQMLGSFENKNKIMGNLTKLF